MPQICLNARGGSFWLVTLLVCLFACAVASASFEDPADEAASLSSAVCPIVYPLDQSASSRGYRYSFFGNGFFINNQGYLLTAAHVLETFRDGGQPYVLLSRPNSPPRLLQATVIATDSEHDVAVLLATPNPFASRYKVTFLTLSTGPASPGQRVLALSLHPSRQHSARSFEIPEEDRSSGEILSYQSAQLDKSAPAAEVFLLSHSVNLGQSGSPVLAAESHAVVGFIEGRWLRATIPVAKPSSQSNSTPGAAIPIRYATALLERRSISWHAPSSLPSSPAP